MKTNNVVKVCGSITKKESLARLKKNTLNHTYIAEADSPYANYYGRVPAQPKPNSIFLFTDKYYPLEQVLRFTQNIDMCAKNEVNVASAIMQFNDHCYPSLRVKNFPDYQHLGMLQQCYIDQGVKFARKVPLEPEAMVTVNKCFNLEQKEEEIFIDRIEKNIGYIVISKYPDTDQFEKLMNAVWNNGNCRIFDGAMGGLIIDGKAINIVRVYSEQLDIDLLKCVKKEISKQINSVFHF